MYRPSPIAGETLLYPVTEAPYLESTELFSTLIETLPEAEAIPVPIIKFGLLTGQLIPRDDEVRIQIRTGDSVEHQDVTTPPKTLKLVRQVLVEIKDDLSEERKQKVGELCQKTGLNRPPSEGGVPDTGSASTISEIDECPGLSLQTEPEDPSEDTESGESEQSEEKETEDVSQSTEASGSSIFDSGKQIKTKGTEKITGKNPYADPNLLKDANLHQGGE
jgi:hypothetical protein